MTSPITAREIHLATKKGTTAEELAAKYGLSTEELFTYIREKMSTGANELIRDLRKNDKKRRKASSKTEPVDETTTTSETVTDYTETNLAAEEVADATEQEGKNATTQTTGEKLENLKRDEKVFSDELIELEKAHEKMAAKRKSILDEAKLSSSRLLSIQQSLIIEEEKIEQLMTEYYDLAASMISNTAERREYEALLEEVRAEIEALNKVSVLIKLDGTIEISKPEFLDVISTEAEMAELAALMQMPESDDYTVKQLKAIAKARILKTFGAEVTSEINLKNFLEE